MTSEELKAVLRDVHDRATEDLTPAALTGRVIGRRHLEADLTAIYAAAQEVAGADGDRQADANLDAFQGGGEPA